jgi:hypothetical protein
MQLNMKFYLKICTVHNETQITLKKLQKCYSRLNQALIMVRFQALRIKIYVDTRYKRKNVIKYGLCSRAEWFLSWSQISKMAGSRSNDIGPNQGKDIWTTFDPVPKALKFEIFSAKNQFACK